SVKNGERLRKRRCSAATFSRLPNRDGRKTIDVCRPNQGPSSKPGGGEWDKTSEVPAVHGASRWWALSKAVKPHFLKRYWRARAQFPAPAASTPEPRQATPPPRPAVT